MASRLGAELLNVVVDTSGGMTIDALRLIQAVGEEGEKWSAGTWTSAAIRRHLTGAVAHRTAARQRHRDAERLLSNSACGGHERTERERRRWGAGERKVWGGE